MRMSASILVVIAATLLVSSTHPQERATPASKEQTDESVKKVKELRKERLVVLKDLTAQLTNLYMNVRAEIDDLLEARRLLSEAELDAAETDAERIEIYKNLIASLKTTEELANARRTAGRGTAANILKARARRLEAEIHLEQAKMKVAKTGK